MQSFIWLAIMVSEGIRRGGGGEGGGSLLKKKTGPDKSVPSEFPTQLYG